MGSGAVPKAVCVGLSVDSAPLTWLSSCLASVTEVPSPCLMCQSREITGGGGVSLHSLREGEREIPIPAKALPLSPSSWSDLSNSWVWCVCIQVTTSITCQPSREASDFSLTHLGRLTCLFIRCVSVYTGTGALRDQRYWILWEL